MQHYSCASGHKWNRLNDVDLRRYCSLLKRETCFHCRRDSSSALFRQLVVYSALTLYVGCQEDHPTCRNWVMRWLNSSNSSSTGAWLVKLVSWRSRFFSIRLSRWTNNWRNSPSTQQHHDVGRSVASTPWHTTAAVLQILFSAVSLQPSDWFYWNLAQWCMLVPSCWHKV